MAYPTQRKGMRRELQVAKRFEEAGYLSIRSSGSHGPFDVIAWNGHNMYLVQVKCNKWPGSDEMQTIREAPSMPNARKLVIRWDDYQQDLKVRWVS